MPPTVRALRGATRVDADTRVEITGRVQELVLALLERNDVDREDVVSVLFTATGDIHSMFPAEAARGVGFGDVPLLCARELDIEGAPERCIRVLMHVGTDKERKELHHVYLHGTASLRDDLPE
ncbi:MAG TPA: chorismate mutase [Acidimicrobiales bacterium]|nr:chorismate mutase [Acidimicrobiales bacterium]